jgi:hypothetical protein
VLALAVFVSGILGVLIYLGADAPFFCDRNHTRGIANVTRLVGLAINLGRRDFYHKRAYNCLI